MSLFAGRSYKAFEQIGVDELLLPFIDPNMNEYSPLHDRLRDENIVPKDRQPEYKHILKYFASGLGSIVGCSRNANIKMRGKEEYRAQKNEHPGSTMYENFVFDTVRDIQAGQLLTLQCDQDNDKNIAPIIVPMDVIETSGVCMDTLLVKASQFGRGAFAKQSYNVGDVVATSPLVHFERSQVEMVVQERKDKHFISVVPEHKIEYKNSQVLSTQLLLNYCYGNPSSNLLLLPLASGVNFINHGTPNVELRWKPDPSLREDTQLMELLEDTYASDLVLEYVATRPIEAGAEIFMNYGNDFETLWKQNQTNFRREIIIADELVPSNWNKKDPKPFGDFIGSKVAPGQMAPIRWNDGTAEVVTPWAFRIGLKPRIRNVLLEYCNRMGITDIFRHVTTDGNALRPGTAAYMELENNQWYLQRPENKWRSNLQWFSPGGSPAHEHYLQALSVAGFDEVLESIGDYLGMDGLVVFHVTFIAVSFSHKGLMHHDLTNTGAKAYNVIIPLILANETGPELDLQDKELTTGRYRYEYNVASMMGDDADHGTSACDYRMNKEMRMAATVYIADVNDDNIENVMQHYTQVYPPKDLDLLKSWKARHWKRGDPTRMLPKPSPSHILA